MKHILRLAIPLALLVLAASPRHASADSCPDICFQEKQACLASLCPTQPSTCQTTCGRQYFQCIQGCNQTGG